ncbi:MAG: hypothetical protein JSR44_04975 [Spirochaetes bacterium]|nr:hypothetical protein [Spirochaetota bacterium]
MAYHELALRNFRLTQFLITRGELRIPAIDTFNAILLKTLAGEGFDAERTELMRDLLVDYLHGYLMAEVHFSAREKKKRAAQIETTLRWVMKNLR